MSEGPNAGQVAYWNEGTGETWAELKDSLDRQLNPLGRRAMAALAPKVGERILDIGCGGGETSGELAAAVGPTGHVTGLDISRPLLAEARRRHPGVTFVEGDAQVFPFEAGAYDAMFSRFGVMFFADPPAAFANIRRALKPGGRLAFVCWRAPETSPIMTLPMQAALAHIPAPPPGDPLAPGPFAFADPERVRGALSRAGFTDIDLAAHDELVGGGDLDASLNLSLRVGPLGRLLREHPDHSDTVIGAVRNALAAHLTPDGVKLGAGVWIVTARAP